MRERHAILDATSPGTGTASQHPQELGPVPIGNLRQYAGKHPALVPESVWRAVQRIMGRGRYAKHHNPYAGLFTCACCGRAITYEPITKKSTGKTYHYHKCAGGKGGHPTGLSVRGLKDELEAAIKAQLDAVRIEDPDVVDWLRAILTESNPG